jgi:hypothetical protein
LSEDSIKFASQKIRFPASRPDDVSYCLDAQLSKASSVRTTWIPVRTFLCVKKFRIAPTCIRSDVSATRPDDTQCSTKLQDFFPKHKYGKIAATVWTTWILVRTRSSIRRVSQFKSRCPDASQHGLDARASDMEITCIRSTVQTTILLVRTCEAFIWKLLVADVRPSGRQGNTVRMRLSNRKDFQRNFQNFGRTVVRPDSL